MSGKLHTGFMHKLLGILFLFFNCVCTAAPIIKATFADYKQAVSMRLAPGAGTTEIEEESRLIASSYVNQSTHFSFRKQYRQRLYQQNNNQILSLLAEDLREHSFASVNFLPRPAYYAFLFRYTPF